MLRGLTIHIVFSASRPILGGGAAADGIEGWLWGPSRGDGCSENGGARPRPSPDSEPTTGRALARSPPAGRRLRAARLPPLALSTRERARASIAPRTWKTASSRLPACLHRPDSRPWAAPARRLRSAPRGAARRHRLAPAAPSRKTRERARAPMPQAPVCWAEAAYLPPLALSTRERARASIAQTPGCRRLSHWTRHRVHPMPSGCRGRRTLPPSPPQPLSMESPMDAFEAHPAHAERARHRRGMRTPSVGGTVRTGKVTRLD